MAERPTMTDAGGPGEAKGGGGGCEKPLCNCSELQPKIDEYNDKLQNLSSKINEIEKFPEKLAKALQDLNEKLKKIKADKTTNTSDDCGCGDILSKIKAAFGGGTEGEKAKNLYNQCCRGGENPNDPFKNDTKGPCGDAADSVEDAPLFTCDIFSPPVNNPKSIKLKVPTCKPMSAKECPDNSGQVQLAIEDGPAIVLPNLEQDAIFDQINKLFNFLSNVVTAASDQPIGNGKGNLKREACLTRLLRKMCKKQVKGQDAGLTQACASAGCGQTIKEGPNQGKPTNPWSDGGDGPGQINSQCCGNFINHLVGKTLTYGHTGSTADRNADSIPDCGADKNESTGLVWSATREGAEEAVKQDLANKQKNSGGCRDTDGGPIKDYTINKGDVTPCTKDNCPCGFFVPDTFEDPDKAEQSELLKRQIRESQDELILLNKQKQQLEVDMNVALSRMGQAKTMDEVRKWEERYKELETQYETVKGNITNLENNISNFNKQLEELRGSNKPTSGFCVKYTYRYCPANSTPREGTKRETGGGAGPGNDPGASHRNFYDLISKILAKYDNGPCPNPLLPHWNECIGQIKGNDPLTPSGRPDSDNNGPTTKPGDPCEKNDSLKNLPAWYFNDCTGADPKVPPAAVNGEQRRPKCVQALNRIMQSWAKQVGGEGGLKDQVKIFADTLGNIGRALKEIENLEKDMMPDKDGNCDINTAKAANAISKAITAIDVAAQNIDKLENLFKDKDE
jgi:inorganic pyrophosphatase